MVVLASILLENPMIMCAFLWFTDRRCIGFTYLDHMTELEERELLRSMALWECVSSAEKVMGTASAIIWNSLFQIVALLL